MAEPVRGGPMEAEAEAVPSDLPPFANAENKALDKAVRTLERDLDDTEAKLVENRDRIGIMSEHLTNVQAEIKFTQSRVEAKNKEVETESHLTQLGERETGRVTKDIERVQTEREGLADKVTSLQNQIYKATEKMDQFKLLMNWNQEEIEQWALAQRQKEEDNAALAKYKHQDEGKTRELRIQQEKLSQAVVAKKEEVSSEVMETQAAQITLDKAADDFRKLHAERQDLIRQWDEAMDAMKHRDSAIAVASEMFSEKKVELRSVKQLLDAQARFLEDEGLNNKEVDARIAFFDREVARTREAHMAEQARLAELNNQVETIKSTLAKAATELAQATAQSTQAKSDLGDKRARLDAARKRYALLKRKLEGEFQQLDTMDAKVAELELMRAEEEAVLRAAQKLNAALQKEQFRRSQALFALRTKERELISEISGGQGQNKNLAARISQLDEQVARQQELLYNVEFQLQQMERKVARAGGQRSEEETKVLNARIEKLTSLLEGVNMEHSMLLDQVKRSEDDLLKARRVNASLTKDRAKIQDTTGTQRLENEMTTRAVKTAVDAKEAAMVDHDVTQLEVKRVRDILALHADEVFSLENRKFQLKLSMEERKQEIEVHRDALRTELKLLRDDVHRITLELNERLSKVAALQNKYACINARNHAAGDGEEHSQAYYVIKAAQEREELQRQGDALDTQIRTAEQEVAALEATLVQLVSANGSFGSKFKRVDSVAAIEERAQLRARLDHTYDKLKFRRQEEAALVMDLQQVDGRVGNLTMEQQRVAGTVDELGRRRAEAQRATDDQAAKLERAQRSVSKLQGRLAESSPQVKEADLCEVRDITRSILNDLSSLSASLVGLGIAQRAEQLGLKLPPPGQSTPVGSRAGSAAGSVAGSQQGSRPGSARSGSVRSAAPPGNGRGGSGLGMAPPMRQVQLGL